MKYKLANFFIVAVLPLTFAWPLESMAQSRARTEPQFEERPDLGAKVIRHQAKSIAMRPPGGGGSSDDNDACGSLDIATFDSTKQPGRTGPRTTPREIVVVTGDIFNTPVCRR